MENEHGLYVGMMVFFSNERPPYRVMAISKRYAVCSRKLNRRDDADMLKREVEMGAYLTFTDAYNVLKGTGVYSIVDFKKSIRSPDNLIFGHYDYLNEVDCHRAIIALLDGEIELSQRNIADLNIDWTKTNKANR